MCWESYDLIEVNVRSVYETVNEEISSFPNLMEFAYTCQPIDVHFTVLRWLDILQTTMSQSLKSGAIDHY